MLFFITCLKLIYCTEKTLGNRSKATHIKSQLAGHFTLGSSSSRNQVQRARPLSVRFPSINADCGGIDIFKGGFSYINEEGFIELMKNIGSAATSYAFNLAIETVSPQIMSSLKYLQSKVQDITSLSINSCEAAAAMIGAVAPRNSKLNENTCKLMASNRGKLTDFVSGRKGCGEGGADRETSYSEMKKIGPDTMYGEFNVAWEVLKKLPSWSQQLKETLMSVTGTVITKADGNFEIIPPKAFDDKFFDAFAQGGELSVYQCNDSQRCLIVREVSRTIDKQENHAAKVKELLFDIEEKILLDQPLTDEEKALIESSQMPIVKIINIMTAYQKGNAPISINAHAEIIAHDMLTHQIRSMIDIIRDIANNLKGVQINEEPLKRYMRQLLLVEDKLYKRADESHKRVDEILKMIQKTQVLEKALHADMRVLASGG